MPLFPLPRVVLLPRMLMPLHVFEPRYRELAEVCIAEARPLAVPLIEPGRESDRLDCPPFRRVAGAGRIIRHELLPDGRYNILVRGEARVAVVEELEGDEAYRVGRAVLLPEESPTDALPDLLTTARSCCAQLGQRKPNSARVMRNAFVRERDPYVFTDRLVALVFREYDERQELLECTSIEERLRRVINGLGRMLAGALTADDRAN